MIPKKGTHELSPKLDKIELNLETFSIHLHFKKPKAPLIVNFDTPSRKFFFALIGLVVMEMKHLGRPGFIHMRKHEKVLKLLDDSIAGKNASKSVDGMWDKIRKTWRYKLPDLETAAIFKIEDRDLIQPYEKGGKYRYDCTDNESDTWAKLFDYDEENIWQFKFAVDSVFLGLNDIYLTLGDLRDDAAWKEFVRLLAQTSKEVQPEKEVVKKIKSLSFYRPMFIYTIIILIVSVFAVWHFYLLPTPDSVKTKLSNLPSIAVMPFINVSGDPDQEYFCDGVSEEIISSLAKFEDLRVISRTSTFYFKNKDFDLRTIAEKLNVDNVLEGSVRVSGDRLRISAQLISVADDSHLWAETYDREMKDIFDIQENLAQEIVCNMKTKLGCKEIEPLAKHYTENLEAHNLYRKGRFHWNKASHKEAIEYFEQALALDPNFALAYTGLADAYNYLTFFFGKSIEEYYPKAKAAALKALAIDDMLAEAHSSLGLLMHRYEWDRTGAAEKAHKRAIELDPGNASVHRYYAEYLVGMGLLDDALAELAKALVLDPLSIDVNRFYGLCLGWANQFDQSIKQFKITLELYPNHPLVLSQLGSTYLAAKRYEDGIAVYEELMSHHGEKNHFVLGNLGYCYGMADKGEEAEKLLSEALGKSKQGYYPAQVIASIYTGLGNKDMAFKWLERAYEQGDPRLWPIRSVPTYRILHTDPRWSVLMKKMGIEE